MLTELTKQSLCYNNIVCGHFSVKDVPLGIWLTARDDGKLSSADIYHGKDVKWFRVVKNLILKMLCYKAEDRFKIGRVLGFIQQMIHMRLGKFIQIPRLFLLTLIVASLNLRSDQLSQLLN